MTDDYEYEPDVCGDCNEELDEDMEHECPWISCEECGNEYNERTERGGCPHCLEYEYENDHADGI